MLSKKKYWEKKEERMKVAQCHFRDMEKLHSDDITKSYMDTVLYTPYIIDDIQKDFKSKKYMDMCILKMDVVSAIMQHAEGKTAVLNFASYKNLGGKFIEGSIAQEESLCHASTLYNVLLKFTDTYYRFNTENKNRALYLDRALYTPDIYFQSGTKYKYADVITCAAPNKTAVVKYQMASTEEINDTLRNRIELVIKIASINKVDTLILGAYGCGVFGHDPLTVAQIFKEMIEKYSSTKKIVFAIPDDNNTPFCKVFLDMV